MTGHRDRARSRRRAARWFALVFTSLLLAGCTGPGSLLDPGGPGARRVEGLWWLLFWISLAVLLIVLALLGYSLRTKGRRGCAETRPSEETPAWGSLIPSAPFPRRERLPQEKQ